MEKMSNNDFYYKWQNNEFESSSETTSEFKLFVKELKHDLTKQMKAVSPNLSLNKFHVGHFDVSAFVENIQTGKFCYFRVGDVRSPNFMENILIRSCKDNRDFSGDTNGYCEYPDIVERMVILTK